MRIAEAALAAAVMLLALPAPLVVGYAGVPAVRWQPRRGEAPEEVTGNVTLAYGLPYIWGPVGTTVTVPAEFAAASSSGEVTEYRAKLVNTECLSEEQLNRFNAPWEAFVVSRTYVMTFTQPNFVYMHLTAQFRDDRGERSEPACDDLALEGHRQTATPRTATATPTGPTPTPTEDVTATQTVATPTPTRDATATSPAQLRFVPSAYNTTGTEPRRVARP